MNTNKLLNSTKLSLSKNEIHLWSTQPQSIDLDIDNNFDEDVNVQLHTYKNLKKEDLKHNLQALTHCYRSVLTPEELKRQQRYKFKKDRHNALVTRAFIRDLLSYYADVEPADWRFEKGEKDKPEIVNPPVPLRFNISHTDGLIICAVTLNDDIGCDVENTTRSNDVLAIADRFFSVKESEALFSLPVEQQRDRFFDYWTLKESYIKAWGLGLAIPLKDFSFDIQPTKLTAEKADIPKRSDKMMNGNISLSFAPHRVDCSAHWRCWLLYPDNTHRIAISIRGETDIQNSDYTFRYFESVPLVSAIEQQSL